MKSNGQIICVLFSLLVASQMAWSKDQECLDQFDGLSKSELLSLAHDIENSNDTEARITNLPGLVDIQVRYSLGNVYKNEEGRTIHDYTDFYNQKEPVITSGSQNDQIVLTTGDMANSLRNIANKMEGNLNCVKISMIQYNNRKAILNLDDLKALKAKGFRNFRESFEEFTGGTTSELKLSSDNGHKIKQTGVAGATALPQGVKTRDGRVISVLRDLWNSNPFATSEEESAAQRQKTAE